MMLPRVRYVGRMRGDFARDLPGFRESQIGERSSQHRGHRFVRSETEALEAGAAFSGTGERSSFPPLPLITLQKRSLSRVDDSRRMPQRALRALFIAIAVCRYDNNSSYVYPDDLLRSRPVLSNQSRIIGAQVALVECVFKSVILEQMRFAACKST